MCACPCIPVFSRTPAQPHRGKPVPPGANTLLKCNWMRSVSLVLTCIIPLVSGLSVSSAV